MSKTDVSTLGAILEGRGLGKKLFFYILKCATVIKSMCFVELLTKRDLKTIRKP